MKPHTASLINALTLIICSAWSYWAINFQSLTALIPGAFGIALLACYSGVKAENKVIAHIAVTLTLIVAIALYMPLASAIGSGDWARLLRSILMMATSIVAIILFIKSFRNARRARDNG